MTTTARTFPGVYLAAARTPGTAALQHAASFGRAIVARGANQQDNPHDPRYGTRRTVGDSYVVPGACSPHAGLGRAGAQVGCGTLSLEAARAAAITAYATSGPAGTRQPFPTAFSPLGSEGPRVPWGATPSAPVLAQAAAAGFVGVAPRVGPGAAADSGGVGLVTPGENGRSTAQAPWWGAPSIAGAPIHAGAASVAMPYAAAQGAEYVLAPPQAAPDYAPIPGAPDNAGGGRVWAPPPGGRPPPPAAARRAPPVRGLLVAAAVAVGAVLLLAPARGRYAGPAGRIPPGLR